MKFIFSKAFLCLSIIFLLFSCGEESERQENINSNSNAIKALTRSASNEPFFDLMYVHDNLNLGITRGGYYPFVTNYMINAESQMTIGSLFDILKKGSIYPCWYCGEPEYIEFNNYYIPFYDLDDSSLDGILIIQEKDEVKSSYYLSHRLVDQIILERTEPYSQYWSKIMDYFDGGTQGKDKKDHFNSRNVACIETDQVQKTCVCQGSGEDCTIFHIPPDINDPVEVDCLTNCFSLDGEGDTGGDTDEEGSPLEVADIESWINNDDSGGGGGGQTTTTTSTPSWDEFCGGFNGSLSEASATINPDGTVNIPLFENPADLYEEQLEGFINYYGLQSQFTPEELAEFIGEECAVSNVNDVIDCVKCHFISSLGLPDDVNWDLKDNNFELVVDCLGDPNINCVDPDLQIDCSSFDFVLVNSTDALPYQSCGVNDINIDFFHEEPTPPYSPGYAIFMHQ